MLEAIVIGVDEITDGYFFCFAANLHSEWVSWKVVGEAMSAVAFVFFVSYLRTILPFTPDTFITNVYHSFIIPRFIL